MLKLLFKFIGLFLAIIIIGEIGHKSLNLDYYWGNIQLNSKLEYLKEENIDPDNYFFGSSVTFRHVIPTIFDSLSKDTGHSINLAADGNFAPQTFHILDHLMAEDTTINYLFLELNGYDFFAQNFRTTRSKYYLSLSDLGGFYPYILASTVSLKNKIGISGMYLYAYFERLTGLGMRQDYLKEISVKNRFAGGALMGKYKDGFYTFREQSTPNKEESKKLPAVLKKLQSDYLLAHQTDASLLTHNGVLEDQYKALIAQTKAKGIRLIFILNPVACVFDKPSEMLGLFYSLPETNRINLADPRKYDELYLVENRWDAGHLNEQGAMIYTELLAKSFNTLIH